MFDVFFKFLLSLSFQFEGKLPPAESDAEPRETSGQLGDCQYGLLRGVA